ncbi:MAG: hypothetical protein J6N95_02945 [Bacilli bacterium]|nr:hypothetical protein [Bacilli bacterium]
MYLTYDEYQEYGGTLDETTFNDFEFEAENIINWYTFDRLKNETDYPEAVKRCMYRLIYMAKLKADAMQLGMAVSTTEETSNNPSPAIQSQSNDGVSISYNVLSASELFNALATKTKGSEVDQIIQRYLQGIKNSLGRKLLYRGFYPGE